MTQRTQKTLYTSRFIPMKQVFPSRGCLPSLSCLLEATVTSTAGFTPVKQLYTGAGATAESIEILRQQCLQAVEPYLRGYIWQRDGFNLEVKPQLKSHKQPGASSSELPTCLQGQATYGDNVEDEWLITWLLLELTRRFQISARAWDSDGEFLLIEAAYALPKCAPT